jgi:hypothetical protein
VVPPDRNGRQLPSHGLGLSGNRRAFVEHATNSLPKRPNTPSLKTAHLSVEVRLKRVIDVQNFFEVVPTHLVGEADDFLLVGPDFRKSKHVKQILLAEAGAVVGRQLSRQRRDYLFTVFGSIRADDFLAEVSSFFLNAIAISARRRASDGRCAAGRPLGNGLFLRCLDGEAIGRFSLQFVLGIQVLPGRFNIAVAHQLLDRNDVGAAF